MSFQDRKVKVHVICGGGSGSSLLRLLLENGFNVTVGVLNVLDSDYETAQIFGLPLISEAPFSPITDESHKANLEFISKAAAVVLCDMPFGFTNLRNLEAAVSALEMGKKVVVINENPEQNRDFTNGKAESLLKKLKNKGAIFVKKSQDAIVRLKSEK